MQLLYLLESIRSLFPDKLFSATALRCFLLLVFIICVWALTFPWSSKG